MASSSVTQSGYYDVFLSFRGEDTRYSFTDHLYTELSRSGIRTFRDEDDIKRGLTLSPEIERAIGASRASVVVLSENYAFSTWCLDELLLILDRRREFPDYVVLPIFYHVDPSDVRKQKNRFKDAFDLHALEPDSPAGGGIAGILWKWAGGVKSFLGLGNEPPDSPAGGGIAGILWKWAGGVKSFLGLRNKPPVERKIDEKKMELWKAALTEVANLTGMVVNGHEAKFIMEVANVIRQKLDRKALSIPPHVIGIDLRAKYINNWLNNKQSNGDILAICGMGGIGKTTLAKYIYNSNSRRYESSCFLEDVRKSSEQPHGLLELQKKLLTNILEGKNQPIHSVSEGTIKIEDALLLKRVLVVLDDIDKVNELNALLGTRQFHPGSKIIITTRVLETFTGLNAIPRKCQEYRLTTLNEDESLELLSWHAFGSKHPLEGFMEYVVKLAQYCAGNPLALQVLGSSLYTSAEDPTKANSMDSWRSTLELLKRETNSEIQEILKISFESLPYDSNKELFLHIACFFVGEDKDYIVKILESKYSASAGIQSLINRCLLTVGPSNKLMMHQLLQEMGREIIRQESPKDPGKRSRIWCSDESFDILRKGKGRETIEGLTLDMRLLKEEKTLKSLALKTDAFTRMDKLMLLQLNYVQLTGSYENFPEDLKWLVWHGYHLKTIPFDLNMGSLVAMDMSYSNLEQFEAPTVWEFENLSRLLKSLKILNLKDSQKLAKIAHISRMPKLENLVLWNCSSLAEICKTITELTSLVLLDMTGCENLMKLPLLDLELSEFSKELDGSGFGADNLHSWLSFLPCSLVQLSLNNCSLFNESFPNVFKSLPLLQYLNLGNNPIDSLPECICSLSSLRVLDLTYCTGLVSILCLPSRLQELYVYYCESLIRITFQSALFRLQKIGYGGCFQLSEIQGLFKLVTIATVDERELKHMKWLKGYQNHEVFLIGNEITEGRCKRIKVLYEFGIMSTFLPGIKDPTMMYEDKSSLSFRVPSCRKNRQLQGLNVSCVYGRSSEEGDEYLWPLFTKVSNTTKGLTWIYNPFVFGRPEFGEAVVWLSYWTIGDKLEVGDEVNVTVVLGDELELRECGFRLVYIDGEEEKEDQRHHMEWEEIIGGDLSEFQLTTDAYYLCRRDFFEFKEDEEKTPEWFRILVGGSIHYSEVQGWSKLGRPQLQSPSLMFMDMRMQIMDEVRGRMVKLEDEKKKGTSYLTSLLADNLDTKNKNFRVEQQLSIEDEEWNQSESSEVEEGDDISKKVDDFIKKFKDQLKM